MKVEILYFDGCPTYLRAEETLRGVLAREGSKPMKYWFLHSKTSARSM